MKQTIFWLLLVFCIGCSNDDELIEEKSSIDPIVGKWHFYSYITGGEEILYKECDQKGSFAFTNDGFGLETKYFFSSAYCCNLDSENKLQWLFDGSKYDIKTFHQGGYGGVLTFPITYQYYGAIYNDYLKIPVGYNDTINFVKKNN
ncbi:MAG: hypothetical protein O3C01_01435 [Bacteroidetes bacterium]|nr:hypothetical protein [Bacteroidota bacterium]